MVGFLDGINDSLKIQNPIEEMDENTEVNLGFDLETLYKTMVDAKQTGYTSCRSGTAFSPKKREKNCIWSRKNPVL